MLSRDARLTFGETPETVIVVTDAICLDLLGRSMSEIGMLQQLLPADLFSKLGKWLAPSVMDSRKGSTSPVYANIETSFAS